MATKTPRKTKKTPTAASNTPASEPKTVEATVTPTAPVSSSQDKPAAKRPTRRLPPATGSCKWVRNCFGKDALRITAQTGTGPVAEEYEVGPSANGYALYKGTVTDNHIEVTRYDIDTVTHYPAWSCSCPDATHREERRYTCKHVRALRAALPTAPKNLADF